eukprot:scaffold53944_cov76-Phaeocystis_antarctica.AAC.1
MESRACHSSLLRRVMSLRTDMRHAVSAQNGMSSRSTIVNRSTINFHSTILNALREFARSDLRSSRTPSNSGKFR